MRTIITISFLIGLAGCATSTHRGAAIRERLSETTGLASHNISIDEATPGIVTLNGSVSSDRDRETIEQVARDTRDVREVRSNLVVNPSSIAVREGYSPSPYDQGAMVSQIRSKMASSPELRGQTLQVDAVGSEVTLRGEVASSLQRDTAELLARDTRGVTGVRNEINLARSSDYDFQISQNVRDALHRRTNADLRNIDITTYDRVVTLRGSQFSSRDIDTIVSSARSVPGVREVRNELTLNDPRYTDRYQQR